MKQKAFAIIFKGLSVAKNCLRLKSAPLTLSCWVVTEKHTYLSKTAVEITRFAEVL